MSTKVVSRSLEARSLPFESSFGLGSTITLSSLFESIIVDSIVVTSLDITEDPSQNSKMYYSSSFDKLSSSAEGVKITSPQLDKLTLNSSIEGISSRPYSSPI